MWNAAFTLTGKEANGSGQAGRGSRGFELVTFIHNAVHGGEVSKRWAVARTVKELRHCFFKT